MAKIVCDVEDIDLPNDDGREIPSVRVTCTRDGCDEFQESYGTSEKSVRRCLALLRENCPFDEENFYVTEED